MRTPRTVTVQTTDYGPVTIECPAWCLGVHPDNGYRVDIFHEGPEVTFNVPTSRGEVTSMTAALEQRPYAERAPGTEVFVNVELAGDHYPSNPAELDAMAAALVEHAQKLRFLSRRLDLAIREW